MGNGTFVGLDVHARSVVAGLIDEGTGEAKIRRAAHDNAELADWLAGLAGPVRVAYEAGPTGYGLARALQGAGIDCLVAAPGRIPRAPGQRVKNDRRDAERLARLLRAGELVPVAVPSGPDEGARDLVRARGGEGGGARTRAPRPSPTMPGCAVSAWVSPPPRGAGRLLRRRPASTPASRSPRRRDRRLAGRPDLAPVVGRLSCLRGVGTLTAVALAVEIGDWQRRRQHRRLPGPGPERAPVRRPPQPRPDHNDRQLPCAPPVGRGRLASPAPAAQERRARAPARRSPPRGARPRRGGGGAPSPPLGPPGDPPGPALDHRGGGRRARAGRLVLEPGRDGRLRARPEPGRGERAGRPADAARGDARLAYEQPRLPA